MEFSKILKDWYLKNRRDLPWRKTRDPYKIWLSEIMLQQTRIEQGLPYYHSFIKAFPTVFDLAEASLEKVLKLWQGLGYYSRARNLHETAQFVATKLNGKFPHYYKDLIKLKGVGDYTASAIASICFNEATAVVDGNVYRVLSRIFKITTPINSTQGKKEFKALAQELIDTTDPSTFNQAVMEFGALHCKPRAPLCSSCPFSTKCLAFNDNLIESLPVKLKKTKVRHRYFNYLVFQNSENKTLLKKRTGRGIWNGLYEFPLIETENLISATKFLKLDELSQLLPSKKVSVELYNEIPIIHKLSHQHLVTRFWIIKTKTLAKPNINIKNIRTYPVPVLIENFLNDYFPEDDY